MAVAEAETALPCIASLNISSSDPKQPNSKDEISADQAPSTNSTAPSIASLSGTAPSLAKNTIPISSIPLRPSAPLHDEQRSDPHHFGTRHLTPDKHVFSANAWDHVEPDAAHRAHAATQYALQRAHAAAPYDRHRVATAPERWWDAFYARNAANFFKDRRWLKQEFGVLAECTAAPEAWAAGIAEAGGGGGKRRRGEEEEEEEKRKRETNGAGGPAVSRQPCVVLEVGAGAGNTAFPLLESNQNPNLMLHACDYSKKAVQLLREHELFNANHMRAEVWDMTSTSQRLPPGVAPGSVDVVVLIFAFSALAPAQWAQAVRNVWRALRPGGEVCFRDYGRGDLAQVRFRKGRWLGENFYMRGDGTRVYFFDEGELAEIWGGGLVDLRKRMVEAEAADREHLALTEEQSQDNMAEANNQVDDAHVPAFKIERLGVDRRLLVNRQKQLKMYRCWMQGSFRKPEEIQSLNAEDLSVEQDS